VPHLFTHSLVHQSASLELQLKKKEERERRILGRGLSVLFELSLGIVLAILRKFLLGFLPHEGFLE
jgi:hypothetical protein